MKKRRSFFSFRGFAYGSFAGFFLLAIAFWFALPASEENVEILPPRPINTIVEWQIALAREGFSPGSIDGVWGEQTRQALLAYQGRHQLPRSGTLDAPTAKFLQIQDPVFDMRRLSRHDFELLCPDPQSWRERGQLERLGYHSILEMVAEESQTDPDLIVELNAGVDWETIKPGKKIRVPRVPPVIIRSQAAFIRIRLSDHILQVQGYDDRILFHCPVSIAQRVDKRPKGELRVKVSIADPNYTFNPELHTAVARGEGISSRFVIQPGPNNPVGIAWIGLDLPGYGIHGTPDPEKVGRTESLGCFRVSNWNAKALLSVAHVDLPVYIEP